jgi:threonyl-tRNA synthetase
LLTPRRLPPAPKKTGKKTRKKPNKKQKCAHLMAMAVQKLFPKTQVTIGPWIDRGFYYDFDTRNVESGPLTEADLKKIRREMQRLVRRNLPLRREDLGSPSEARKRLEAAGEPYKLEILDSILAKDPNAEVTIYHVGEDSDPDHWWDLCAGPHVPSTGAIDPDAFDLESLAGAYWRGDSARPMLQRVYGTAWSSPDQLRAYGRLKQEAARRDHRRLGQDLDLFSLRPDSAGGGLVFWHPKGAAVRSVVEDYWRKLHARRGYELVYSPHIARADLWRTSGHLDFYSESMFSRILVDDGEKSAAGGEEATSSSSSSDGNSGSGSGNGAAAAAAAARANATGASNDPLAAAQRDNAYVGTEYQLKPMNCPFHVEIYRDRPRSYRDLPIRWAELGTVYRYEQSGALHGLFRVRGFTQDDAHIFCLPDQIASEIKGVLDLIEEILSAFGFTKYEVNLSTRPEQSVGGDEVWATAEAALEEALAAKGWSYSVDEGGGAFYGPKIDLKIQDAIGRKWQCSTVQLDFNLPERFGLSYTDADNAAQRPIMIHRAIFGSIERFFGILVENYAGAFPLWLAPVQVRLLPVNDAVAEYAKKVAEQMAEEGIRVEVMERASIAKMVRNAERAKTPVMCVVGAREAELGELSVRLYGGADLGSHKAEEVVEAVRRADRGRKATVDLAAADVAAKVEAAA